ncbi:MAG: pyridoxamine 5'-phosphate oxidase family protein [Anaerolineae bacterium]|nr:pyridoxamine 5'-phosphate oxidase family protein [Anaerolineae bacterium]
MFRKMRRKAQELSREETLAILTANTAGVLGVSGDEDYPYTVPVSYVYHDGRLFFHCASEGHKIDGIQRNDKVSFCVIDRDEVIQATFTTHFRSAIVFGRARILTDEHERRTAVELLVKKYSPDYVEEGRLALEKSWNRTTVVEIRIEHMSGKAAIELIRASAS